MYLVATYYITNQNRKFHKKCITYIAVAAAVEAGGGEGSDDKDDDLDNPTTIVSVGDRDGRRIPTTTRSTIVVIALVLARVPQEQQRT